MLVYIIVFVYLGSLYLAYRSTAVLEE